MTVISIGWYVEMLKKKISNYLVIISILITGCGKYSEQGSETYKEKVSNDENIIYSEESGNDSAATEKNAESMSEYDEIIEKLNKLNISSKWEDIVNLMGEPDYTRGSGLVHFCWEFSGYVVECTMYGDELVADVKNKDNNEVTRVIGHSEETLKMVVNLQDNVKPGMTLTDFVSLLGDYDEEDKDTYIWNNYSEIQFTAFEGKYGMYMVGISKLNNHIFEIMNDEIAEKFIQKNKE